MIQPLLIAALFATQAAATTPPCITREEAGNLAVALMPHLIEGLEERCRPHLAADAFLPTRGEAFAERLRRDAGPRRELALRAIAKIGGVDAPPEAGGDAAFDFVGQMMASGLLGSIPPESCDDVDALFAALEPLPADNMAGLIGAILSLARVGERDPDEAGDGGGPEGPPICRS